MKAVRVQENGVVPLDPEGYLPTRRVIEVRPLLWACSVCLAKARMDSNSNRAKRRDRGASLNFKGDVLGSFGELYVFFMAFQAGRYDVVNHMRRHIFHPRGGKATSDVLDAPGLDVKTFGCEEHKRYIATNAASHRNLEGRLQHYYFLLTPPLGVEAVVSSLIPWNQVGRWPEFPLGSYGDSSHNLGLNQFLQEYGPEHLDLELLRANRYSAETILHLIPEAQKALRKLFPTLRSALPE